MPGAPKRKGGFCPFFSWPAAALLLNLAAVPAPFSHDDASGCAHLLDPQAPHAWDCHQRAGQRLVAGVDS